jgi:phage repressor protein C with HTH and peptisase S24 domain
VYQNFIQVRNNRLMKNDYARLLLAARQLKGWKGPTETASGLTAAGYEVSEQTMTNWKSRGVSSIGYRKAARIIGCRPAWLEFEEGDMEDRTPSVKTDKEPKPPAAPGKKPASVLDDASRQGATMLRFEKHPVTMSAGPGNYANHYDRDAIDTFEVADWWARQFIGSVDPARIKVVPSRGSSMSPTIPDGSLLFVDTSVRRHVGDGIYCIDLDGRLMVKRIHVRAKDRVFEVISDNPDGPPPDQYQLQDEDRLCICGKVVAWLATHRET